MAGSSRSGRRKGLGRALPASYAVVALLVVAFVLPSALRPPPDTTQSGSAYSPDAPPNSKSQSVIKTQLQPGSNTAGQEGPGGSSPTPTPPPPSPSPTSTKGGASTIDCAYNWDPPRQWDSVYAPPCMPSFVGDNGGDLQPGVSATEWNMVVSFYGQQQTDGWINDTTAKSSAQLRTLNDIMKYFNKHAMMYNRKLKLAYAKESAATASESDQRADVVNAIAKYHPIAAQIEGTAAEINEYTKAHVVNSSWLSPIEAVYQQNKPYSWSQLSPTFAAKLASEWICKQLKGYPPIAGVTTGNAGFDPKAPRKWGSVQIPLAWANSGPTLLAGLKTCGIEPVDQAPGVDMVNEIQQALLKFQSEGVTSVILNTDLVDGMLFEIQASQINYYPEWITTGWGGMDQDAYLVRDVPADQLKHTFGLSMAEVNLDPKDMECYKAVAEVDSGYVAHPLYCHIYWEMISHAVAAVQLNGPRLTRESLAQTYTELPTVANTPKDAWAFLGDYKDPSRRSWPNAASVWWWDTQRIDADGGVGTEAYGDCGRRYTAGTFPTGPAHIFTSTGFVTGPTFYSKCTPIPWKAQPAPRSKAGSPTWWPASPPEAVPFRRRTA